MGERVRARTRCVTRGDGGRGTAPGVQGKLPYSGNVDCAMKILKHEGVLGFYKGFGTFLIRIGPHVSMTLILLDVMKRHLP
jgi:hypothetical protein